QGQVSLGTASRTVDVAASGRLHASAVISGTSSGSLSKTGVGLLELSGNNTYAGFTFLNQGVISLLSGTGLEGIGGLGTSVDSGASLHLDGATFTTNEGLALNGSGTAGEGAAANSSIDHTISGGINVGAATVIGVNNGARLTLGGFLGAAGDLTKIGAGEL